MKRKRLKEIWKDIPDYEGYYQVSNLGRVRSVDREVEHNTSGILKLKGKLLKFSYSNTGGYTQYTLSKNGITETIKVCYLVMFAFVGLRPEGMQILHNDGNPRNNALYNLRYGTQSDNERDKKKHGTGNDGSRNGQSKLTKGEVVTIRERYNNESITQRKLASEFDVTQQTICDIINLRSWNHV